MKRALIASAVALSLAACSPEAAAPEAPADDASADTSTLPEDDTAAPADAQDDEGDPQEIEDTGEPGDTGAQDTAAAGFLPAAGDWVVVESELLDDGCGLSDLVDRGEPGTILILDLLGGSDFEMTFTTGGEIVSCSVDPETLEYACDPADSVDETPAAYGLNATIPVTLTSGGQFDSDVEMRLVSTAALDCEGEDCFWVELLLGTNFPCEVTLQSDVSAE